MHIHEFIAGAGARFIFEGNFELNEKRVTDYFTVRFDSRGFHVSPIGRTVKVVKPKREGLIHLPEADPENEFGFSGGSRGPHFDLQCVGPWLTSSLFLRDVKFPARYSFRGPTIGQISNNSGADAMNELILSRLIQEANFTFRLDTENLDVHLCGIAGPALEGSYPPATADDSYRLPVNFKIVFAIPVGHVLAVLGLNSNDTNYYQKSLESMLQTVAKNKVDSEEGN